MAGSSLTRIEREHSNNPPQNHQDDTAADYATDDEVRVKALKVRQLSPQPDKRVRSPFSIRPRTHAHAPAGQTKLTGPGVSIKKFSAKSPMKKITLK